MEYLNPSKGNEIQRKENDSKWDAGKKQGIWSVFCNGYKRYKQTSFRIGDEKNRKQILMAIVPLRG